MPTQRPDAEALCRILADQMRPQVDLARTALVGIHTGGVWVAERLHALLGLHVAPGVLNISFHRDDYNQRGLQANMHASLLPFETEGSHIIIVDDVLYTGRTIRAAMNELFDYGRPEKIELAVLVDRGGRELPIAADYCAHTLTLAAAQMLELEHAPDGSLSFRLTEK